MTEVYKGHPIEPMYEVWKAQEDKKAESHRKKLERDRKAKVRWRAKQKVQAESANPDTSE